MNLLFIPLRCFFLPYFVRDSCPNTLPIQMSKAHPYSGTYSRASSSPLSDYISPVTPSSNYNVLQSPNDDLTDGQSRKDRTARCVNYNDYNYFCDILLSCL